MSLLLLLLLFQGTGQPEAPVEAPTQAPTTEESAETPAADAKAEEENKRKSVFVDRVAIKVNDKIITERELFQAYRQRRGDLLRNLTGADLDQGLKQAWDDTVNDLEDSLLLYEKAVELGLALSEDDSRGRLMAIRDSNGMSDEEFEEVLQQQTGMTLDEYVDFRTREDSAQYVIQSQIISKIKIDDSEIAKYFDEHKNEFMKPETYRIAEIVFLKNEEQDEKTRLANCLAFLEQGGDFAEAARKFSDSTSRENGGDLGDVQFGDFNQQIENRVRDMKVGEVSKPFETGTAWFVIKLLNRTEAAPKPVEEVREDILNRMRMPRMETNLHTYIEDLKGRYLLHTYLKEKPWYLSE